MKDSFTCPYLGTLHSLLCLSYLNYKIGINSSTHFSVFEKKNLINSTSFTYLGSIPIEKLDEKFRKNPNTIVSVIRIG